MNTAKPEAWSVADNDGRTPLHVLMRSGMLSLAMLMVALEGVRLVSLATRALMLRHM